MVLVEPGALGGWSKRHDVGLGIAAKSSAVTGEREGVVTCSASGAVGVTEVEGGVFDTEATLHSLATLSLDDEVSGDWSHLKTDMDG